MVWKLGIFIPDIYGLYTHVYKPSSQPSPSPGARRDGASIYLFISKQQTRKEKKQNVVS